jgi:hypothetical protein
MVFFIFLPPPLVVTLIIWSAAAWAAVVGSDQAYVAPSLSPVASSLPLSSPPVVSAPSPPAPSTTAERLRRTLQQNGRIIALTVSACVLTLTLGSCALSSDSCVRRRLNRNRRLPIGVEPND